MTNKYRTEVKNCRKSEIFKRKGQERKHSSSLKGEATFGWNMRETTVCLVGDGSSGKSSIIRTLTEDGSFSTVYAQTIGCDFHERRIKIRENLVSLRVWDIGGQSIHSKNIKQYVNAAQAVFLVYDVTNLESFMNLDDWLATLIKNGVKKESIYLVGNKIDMIGQRVVEEEKHNALVEENFLKDSFFMSAKTADNLLTTFVKVAGLILDIELTDAELEIYSKVVKATGKQSGDDEGRTAFADAIEEEDRLAALKAEQDEGCICSIA